MFFFYQGIVSFFPKTVLWLTNYLRDQLRLNLNSRFSISLQHVALLFNYDSFLFFLGAIIGFSSSEGTIQRWGLTSHVVAKIKSDMEERLVLKNDVAKPKDL